MKTIHLILIVLVLVAAGCAGKSKAKLREENAFLKGQQQAIAAQQLAQQPTVWFRGLVRKTRVPWTEDLTLAQALLAADYTGLFDPTSITITRQGHIHRIDPKRLLRGQEDPVLEPGDLVDVTR